MARTVQQTLSNDSVVAKDSSPLGGDHTNCTASFGEVSYAKVGKYPPNTAWYASHTVFTNMGIPQGSNIEEAYYHLYFTDVTGEVDDARFYCEDADDPSVCSSIDDFTSRDGTDEYNGLELGSGYGVGTSYDVHLVNEIQEVVDRSGFDSNSNIAIITAADFGQSEAADGYKAWGPNGNSYLYVKYTAPPEVSTDTSDSIGENTATIHGTLQDDGGESCDVWFRYKKSSNSTWNTTGTLSGQNTGDSYFSDLTGLDSGTQYDYQAVASNSVDTDYGATYTFTTDAAIVTPTADTDSATLITSTSATLNGSVSNDGGENCEVRFRWQKSGGSWNYTDWQSGFSTGDNFSQGISFLDSNATYEFEAIVSNSAGTDYGSQLSFTTDVGTPTAQTDSTTSIGTDNATLNGTVSDDGGQNCDAWFKWKLSSNSTWNTTASTAGLNTNDSWTANISGLISGTSYDVRAVVSNSSGTDEGSTNTFWTTVATPVAQTDAATSIGNDNATLNGTVADTGGELCTGAFRWREVGGNWNYTSGTSSLGIGDPFFKGLTGLSAGTDYEFEASVTNSAGTDYGDTKSFTTYGPVGNAGFFWVEGSDLTFTDEMGYKKQCNIDTNTSVTAQSGYLWIDGSDLHYISANGNDNVVKASVDTTASANAGYLWTNGNELYYTAENGDVYQAESIFV